MPEPTTRVVDLLITGAAEVLTCAGDASDEVGRITGAGVAIDAGEIVAAGDVSSYQGRRAIEANGQVVMPGFVDAHTHVVFGGSRVDEYVARVAGLEPPPGAPIGIVGTTKSTRDCSVDQLVDQAGARIAEMASQGTTTIESKSGYGLDPAAELRILRASAALDQSPAVDVVTTYLGAHAFPHDRDPTSYIDQVVDQIPEVAELGLAEFCDVYCDEGYFDLAQTRRILETGIEHGLRPKLHLDAYSHTGAAELAAELGALSADHLNFTPPDDLRRLAEAGVVGVYMPCLDYTVAHPSPVDGRALLDSGIEIALATDICPGCWTTSMQLAIAMACRSGGLSVAQAIRAATYGAARSLGRADRVGSLEPGKQADLIICDVPTHQDIAYRLGRNSVTTVIKNGVVVKGPTS